VRHSTTPSGTHFHLVQMGLTRGFAVAWFCLASTQAQILPPPATVGRASTSTQAAAVAPGAAPTAVSVIVDSIPAGGDQIEVVASDPAVSISLVLPGGATVNDANAGSLGINWAIQTVNIFDVDDFVDPSTIPGTHVSIQLPPGSPPGTYQIQANGSQLTAAAALLVQYFSSSSILFGAATDSSLYRLGQTVTLAGILSDGSTPIQNASVTAQAFCLTPIAATVGNYQLLNQQQVGDSLITYTYTAQLTNSGGDASSVEAALTSTDQDVQIDSGTLSFGNITANQTASSQNAFIITLPLSKTLDPNTLNWQITAASSPIPLTLLDSGTGADKAAADAAYTVAFTSMNAGDYEVLLTATGTSTSGATFSRTATASFAVAPAIAQFVQIADVGVTDPGSGLLQSVTITGSVNVQAAGTYQFSLDLVGSNNQTGTAALQTGAQQIAAIFSSAELQKLAVDGPYEKRRARLTLINSGSETLADYVDDAGPTQAYSLSTLDPGPLYFTGQNSVAGVTSGSNTTFDFLRAQLSVFSPGGSVRGRAF
jgi:hypothetical protein